MLKVDKERFRSICDNSISMAQAAARLGLHFNTFRKYAIAFGTYKPNMGLKGGTKKARSKINLTDVLNGKYPSYPTRMVKERLIKNGLKKLICEKCGGKEWNNKPIPLELNHINGNRTDHRKENLELICPNCHAQTETYRGKNKSLTRVI